MAADADLLNLQCEGSYSCRFGDIYCPFFQENACNINCTSNDFAICNWMDVFVENNFIHNYLNIGCPNSNDKEACNRIRFDCNSKERNSEAEFVFDNRIKQYQCYGSYCCPWNSTTSFPTIASTNVTTHSKINSTIVYLDLSTNVNVTINRTKQLNVMDIIVSNTLIIVVATVLLLIVLCSIIIIYRSIRNRDKNRNMNEFISNALVVVIGIGDYENIQSNDPDIDANCQNLPVEKDIDNMFQLFDNLLNYKVIPPKKLQTTHWTETKLINLLKTEIGNELFDENNELQYDGFILCISAHGITNKIITSDYRTIEKSAIHRIISLEYPKIRSIPRIFIYDSCNGTEERRYTFRASTISSADISKCIELEAVSSGVNQWTQKLNPDYKLVQINASNLGFQAKCDLRFGSFLIYEFTQKMKQNIEKTENKTLATIFDEIQNDLHDRGKQQTTNTFNNNTRNLRFKINTNPKNSKSETNKTAIELMCIENKCISPIYVIAENDKDDEKILNDTLKDVLQVQSVNTDEKCVLLSV